MSRWLRQSTTVTIPMGPALDATDGVSEEVGLSPTVEVSLNNGAFGARTSATAITHDANGWYRVELDATDTGTLGPFIAKFDDAATHLPVWHEFEVVTANVYDSRYSTDILDVELTAAGIDAILDEAITEPVAIFTWPATLRTVMGWLGAVSRNKITQTATTQTIRDDADAADIAASTLSSSATTFTRGEFT
jgi:hypothetical protein